MAVLTHRLVQVAHVKQQLDERLSTEVSELEQLVTVEGGRRLNEEIQELRSSYQKQRRDAERSMVEANQQAASAMRGQLEKEHKVRTCGCWHSDAGSDHRVMCHAGRDGGTGQEDAARQ